VLRPRCPLPHTTLSCRSKSRNDRIDDGFDLLAILRRIEKPARSASNSSKPRRPWYRAICWSRMRLDPEKFLTLRDQLAVAGHDAHDRTRIIALNFVEELHRFEHAQDVAGFDPVANFDIWRHIGDDAR